MAIDLPIFGIDVQSCRRGEASVRTSVAHCTSSTSRACERSLTIKHRGLGREDERGRAFQIWNVAWNSKTNLTDDNVARYVVPQISSRILLRESIDVKATEETGPFACHDRCTTALHRGKVVALRVAHGLAGIAIAQIKPCDADSLGYIARSLSGAELLSYTSKQSRKFHMTRSTHAYLRLSIATPAVDFSATLYNMRKTSSEVSRIW